MTIIEIAIYANYYTINYNLVILALYYYNFFFSNKISNHAHPRFQAPAEQLSSRFFNILICFKNTAQHCKMC